MNTTEPKGKFVYTNQHVFLWVSFRYLVILSLGFSTVFAQAIPSADSMRAARKFSIGSSLAEKAKYDSSLVYFHQAAAIYESIVSNDSSNNNLVNLLKCYNSIANCFLQKDQSEIAIIFLNKALKLGSEGLGDNHPEVATSYDIIARVYVSLGEANDAIAHANKALKVRLQTGAQSLDVADSYFTLGNIYLESSDKDFEYFSKALSIRQEILGEQHGDVAASYHSMARVYSLRGDRVRSIEYVQRALAIYLELFGENHPGVGHCYNLIGANYGRIGEPRKALEYYFKSGQIFMACFGEVHQYVARSYVNSGISYFELGDYDNAIAHQRKAITIFKELFGDKQYVGNGHRRLGNYYAAKGAFEDAINSFKESLRIKIRPPISNRIDVAKLYSDMGELYRKQAQPLPAVSYFQRAMNVLVVSFKNENIFSNPPLLETFSASLLLDILVSKAEALTDLFETQPDSLRFLEMGISTFVTASQLVDKIRNSYDAEESKLSLGEKNSTLYEKAIRASLRAWEATKDERFKESAFYFAEKNKATILFHALQESKAKQFAGIPATLLERERKMKIDLTHCEIELQKEKENQKNGDKSKVQELEDRLFFLRREYEKMMTRFEKAHPRYYEMRYENLTASVADLKKALRDGSVLVEYFLGDSTIFSFVISRHEFSVTAIKRDKFLGVIVSEIAKSLKNVSSKREYLESAARLYQVLVKPIAPFVAGKHHWVIIPDGELYQFPFEILLTDEIVKADQTEYAALPYLLNKHEISYHFSASLFLKSQREQAVESSASLFAGFAPVFSKNGALNPDIFGSLTVARPDASSFLMTRDGKALDELKYSAQELETIAQSFSYRGRIYLHEEASEENFKANAKNYKYVHVATHGFINNENPKLSNLAFSQPQNSNAKEDGILYSGETYNLDLNADLLVLSACQTGAGKIVKGEGLMALTRGFFYSGARNIVASLWKVYDEHTSRLMVEFYREIAAGKSYSAALREAKLKMIANPETAAPQSWAGFVLIGR